MKMEFGISPSVRESIEKKRTLYQGYDPEFKLTEKVKNDNENILRVLDQVERKLGGRFLKENWF